ncbi:hypothetical protein [Chelativorans sp. YIM 93263]|uniref:hypothetical protein n=1 Tax=Chelativorans sp. YIM 93263 TaxID=2906648 RepID=UPI002377ED50|nr:hypothetical protein [Chelativorans sp. YIM 93263]
MDDGFRELKQQLVELSETINRFESEAVQLRIVELFFEERAQHLGHLSEGEAVSYVSGPGQLGRAGERAPRSSRKQAAKGPSASGAVAVLEKLVASDFFEEKRTIRDVVWASEERFGAQYRANAFSGPLSRYARKGELKREKNAEGKYVYFK